MFSLHGYMFAAFGHQLSSCADDVRRRGQQSNSGKYSLRSSYSFLVADGVINVHFEQQAAAFLPCETFQAD